MPKKDVNEAIRGMLSSAGSATRPVRTAPAEKEQPAMESVSSPLPEVEEQERAAALVVDEALAEDSQQAPEPEPEPAEPLGQVESPRALRTTRSRISHTAEVPRTLRLRPAAAQALREAWIEAKHEDVMLTAQDFASELIEEMLKIRRRRENRAAS